MYISQSHRREKRKREKENMVSLTKVGVKKREGKTERMREKGREGGTKVLTSCLYRMPLNLSLYGVLSYLIWVKHF